VYFFDIEHIKFEIPQQIETYQELKNNVRVRNTKGNIITSHCDKYLVPIQLISI